MSKYRDMVTVARYMQSVTCKEQIGTAERVRVMFNRRYLTGDYFDNWRIKKCLWNIRQDMYARVLTEAELKNFLYIELNKIQL